jgi:type IV fimbrial biogenesis protein FimT
MKTSANATRRQGGVTLVESMLAVAIMGLAVSATVPSFVTATEKRRLEGEAAQLRTDIHLARSESVRANQTLRLTVSSGSSGSCYVIHTGSASACPCLTDAPPVCTKGAQALRSVRLPANSPIRLSSNVASMVFDPQHGTTSPTGTMRLTSPQGRELRLVVNIMGRVRTCAASPGLQGYPLC